MALFDSVNPVKLPAIRTRGALIAVAVAVQAVVLVVGWTTTFRIVRDRFAKQVEQRVIEQNVEITEKIAQLLPDNLPSMLRENQAEWESVQRVIENLTELPGEGFACVIEPSGEIVCHPDIRHDPLLEFANLGDKVLTVGLEQDSETLRLADSTENTASGRVQFVADGVHYVATKKLPGSDLRLLVHQPQHGLLQLGRDATQSVALIATGAGLLVTMLTGGGLFLVVRRYDSFVSGVNRKLEESLDLARTIQSRTLPSVMPQPTGYQLVGWSESADQTGGDSYDAVGLCTDATGSLTIDEDDPSAVALLLADATGHGIGPALSVTQLRSMLRVALRTGIDPIAALRHINTQLEQDLPTGRFITAWAAMLDTRTNTLISFSAGQGPIYLRRASGAIEELPVQSWPLGVSDRLAGDAPAPIALQPGDVVLAASDGIAEAFNEQNQQFGEDRVRAALHGHASRSAEQIIEALRAEVDRFAGSRRPDDDRTILVLKRSG